MSHLRGIVIPTLRAGPAALSRHWWDTAARASAGCDLRAAARPT
jgi:hypothetical protein